MDPRRSRLIVELVHAEIDGSPPLPPFAMDQTLYETPGGRYLLRDDPPGEAGRARHATGVALGPAVQKVEGFP